MFFLLKDYFNFYIILKVINEFNIKEKQRNSR